MKILVIEDNPANIESAKKSLAGHEVTVLTTLNDAFNFFMKWMRIRSYGADGHDKHEVFPFDFVLTDLHISTDGYLEDTEKGDGISIRGLESLPAGMALAMAVANLGVRVGIVSDSDHHKNAYNLLLDVILSIPGNPIQIFRAPSPKNWAGVLQRLQFNSPEEWDKRVETSWESILGECDYHFVQHLKE